MTRRSPFIENQPGSPERRPNDLIAKLRRKAQIITGQTSGARFTHKFRMLLLQFGQFWSLGTLPPYPSTTPIPNPDPDNTGAPAFTFGFNFGFKSW